MYGEVINFPNQHDRENIQIAIVNFANSKYEVLRNEMHQIISRIMARHNVSSWPMGDYKVVKAGDGIIDIVPRVKVNPNETRCSKCGRFIFRQAKILRVHEGSTVDEYVMGCPCGHVFGIDRAKGDEA